MLCKIKRTQRIAQIEIPKAVGIITSSYVTVQFSTGKGERRIAHAVTRKTSVGSVFVSLSKFSDLLTPTNLIADVTILNSSSLHVLVGPEIGEIWSLEIPAVS